jgi:hypothetical protein
MGEDLQSQRARIQQNAHCSIHWLQSQGAGQRHTWTGGGTHIDLQIATNLPPMSSSH